MTANERKEMARRKAKREYDRRQRQLDISLIQQQRIAAANPMSPARRSADIRERAYQAVQRELKRLHLACQGMPEPKVSDLARYRMATPWLRF